MADEAKVTYEVDEEGVVEVLGRNGQKYTLTPQRVQELPWGRYRHPSRWVTLRRKVLKQRFDEWYYYPGFPDVQEVHRAMAAVRRLGNVIMSCDPEEMQLGVMRLSNGHQEEEAPNGRT
jgi:hypothetical protein